LKRLRRFKNENRKNEQEFMNILFFLSAAVAIASTVLVITRTNTMHALLNLILSFLAVALMFFALGAPFIAAMEVIVYAGAIMVLFLFAIMLLNLGSETSGQERQWLKGSGWAVPALMALILLGELFTVLLRSGPVPSAGTVVDPRAVGGALFSTYLIGVELASILLLASLIGAYHLGTQRREAQETADGQMMEKQDLELKTGGQGRSPIPAAEEAVIQNRGQGSGQTPPTDRVSGKAAEQE
jgi:NADH-quinone oxidoreductase subunit J